jgi:RNA recognition motif-containing protein
MLKRQRDENKRVVVRGLEPQVRQEDVALVFSRFGSIGSIKFLSRKSCLVCFGEAEYAANALTLNQTYQPSLHNSLLQVSLDVVPLPNKRQRRVPGSFVVVNPPRGRNLLIPVLPSVLYSAPN